MNAGGSLSDAFRRATSPEKERLAAEQRAVMDQIQDLAGEIGKTFRRAEKAHREGKAGPARRAVEKWVAMIEALRSLEARQSDLANRQLRECWRIVQESLASEGGGEDVRTGDVPTNEVRAPDLVQAAGARRAGAGRRDGGVRLDGE